MVNLSSGGHTYFQNNVIQVVVVDGSGSDSLLGVGSRLLPQGGAPGPAMLVAPESTPNGNPLEKYLHDQLDTLRDRAETIDPHEALRGFMHLHDTLPPDASGLVKFRAKALVGHRHLALGDREEAARWLIEAFHQAPHEPRAITNKALGLWSRGDDQAAYDYAAEMIAADPTNEGLASYIPQIAAVLPHVEDGLEHVPAPLRETEAIVVAQANFLRARDRRPEWWTFAREGLDRFPASKHLQVLTAFSVADEITRDETFLRTLILDEGQKHRMKRAAERLDEYWQAKAGIIKNRFDDVQHALAASLVAWHLLDDEAKVVERATRIADETLDNPKIVAQALHFSILWGKPDLAGRLAEQLPEDPEVSFQRGILALQHGDWRGAADAFARAEVPEEERAVVDTVIAIADIKRDPADETALRALLPAADKSPRSLVLISRIATQSQLDALALDVFKQSVTLIEDDTHMSSRLMVAALAVELGTPSDLIDLIDGKLPWEGHLREHVWLAHAHVNERPRRPRNVAFFNGLPRNLRDHPAIARAHASVLLDIKELPQAKAILRRLHEGGERDSYVVMRLLEAYRKTGDNGAADELLRDTDLAAGRYPQNDMSLAAEVAALGESLRAYRVAYDIVRQNPDNGDLAMGYVGLHLFKDAGGEAFVAEVGGRDACVTIDGPDGEQRTHVIDDGPGFLGIHVVSPTGPIGRMLEGKRVGDTISLSGAPGETVEWRVSSVSSKYLHLHLLIMNGFQTMFPGARGLVKMTIEEGNIDAVLAIVRRRAEHNEHMARFYFEHGVPMAMVARLMGGDPVGFAGYVRSLGAEIATNSGFLDHLKAGLALAEERRGRGVAMDAYTIFVAAEMDVLGVLRASYGAVHVPQSAVDMIDKMIAHETEGLGREQMSVGWHDGGYVKEVYDDEQRTRRIERLKLLLERIAASCQIHSVLAPNVILKHVATILEAGGSHILDAAFLAEEQDALLLSDDFHFRTWAATAGAPNGIWLQAALLKALQHGDMTLEAYGDAVVQLAWRRHDHVGLNEMVLFKICVADEERLQGFKEALHYLAGPRAEPRSNFSVIVDLLRLLWHEKAEIGLLRRQAATSAVLQAILNGQKDNWKVWFEALRTKGPQHSELQAYIRQWLRGHFLLTPARPAVEEPRERQSKRSRRRKKGRR